MRWALPLSAALAAVAVSHPILGNYFFQDDFGTFYELANFGVGDFLWAPAAGHMYVVRNLILWPMFAMFRLESVSYFALVLATHVVNVVLLYAVVSRLTGDRPLGWFGALPFAACPLHTGTLGWLAVYGQVMAATAVLVGLLIVIPRPDDDSRLDMTRAIAAGSCLLVASQCFGAGAAAALVFPLVVLLLRRPASPRVVVVLCVVPLLVIAAWSAMNAVRTRLNTYPIDLVDVGVGLRWSYRVTAGMFVHVLTLGVAALLAGDFYPLDRYPDATAVLLLAALAAGLTWALVRASSATRRALLAFLVLVAACYASIAVARAGTFIVLRPNDFVRSIVGAPRYHYLAQVALTVVVCLVVGEVARGARWASSTRGTVLAVWAACGLVGALWLRPSIDHYDANRAVVDRARASVAERVRESAPGARACIPNERAPVAVQFPGTVGIFT